MGGKSRNSQRTKNNAKPSSSSRSAELLGAAATSFVGFSAHADHGLVAVAPGFAASELSDTLDGVVNSEYQLIFKKMTKKDPMTKARALQEFKDLLADARVDRLKEILPFWPKYYFNLANDVEHNVRELAQLAMQSLVQKCKRNIAPYLKQLIPVWVTSFYDTYAPAGSIAQDAFQQTFVTRTNRTTEVCLHCQFEIIDYIYKNLINHTPGTLTNNKTISKEDAEMKYKRLVQCSLKGLAFFVVNTKSSNMSQAQVPLNNLLNHPKFWTYAKSETPGIKAAFFELINEIMQSESVQSLATEHKEQIINASFANITESDPLPAPYIWGTVLLVQQTYDDWYIVCKFNTVILPKLFTFFGNNFNHNTDAVAPSLLPFFSKITPVCLQDITYKCFCKKFFASLKSSILTSANANGRMGISNLLKAYFECLRLLYRNLSNDIDRNSDDDSLTIDLLDENLFALLLRVLSEDNVIVKNFFQEFATLITFWVQQLNKEDMAKFYTPLLNRMWRYLHMATTNLLKRSNHTESEIPERLLIALKNLHETNPTQSVSKVKFAIDTVGEQKNIEAKAPTVVECYLREKLAPIVIELVKFGLSNLTPTASRTYVQSIFQIITLFDDKPYYESFTDEQTLSATVKQLLITRENVNRQMWNIIVDIAFKVLEYFDKPQVYTFIEENMLMIPDKLLSRLVVGRLLGSKYCNAKEIREMFAKPYMHDIFVQIAHDVLSENSVSDFDILLKIFDGSENDELPITIASADTILKIMYSPFVEMQKGTRSKISAKFFTRTMSVIVKNKYASMDVIESAILEIIKYTIDWAHLTHSATGMFSELTDLWQAVIFQHDIITNSMMMECSNVFTIRATNKELIFEDIECISELAAKFLISCTGSITVQRDWLNTTYAALKQLLYTSDDDLAQITHFKDHCLFFEALDGQIAIPDEISEDCAYFDELPSFLRFSAFKLTTIMRLMIIKSERFPHIIDCMEDDDSDDEMYDPIQKQCANLLLRELILNIHIAAGFNSLLKRKIELTYHDRQFIIKYVRHIRDIIVSRPVLIAKFKKLLMENALKETNISAFRALMYLHFITCEPNNDGHRPLITIEELLDYFRNSNRAYVYIVQYSLLNMKEKALDSSYEMKPLWAQLVMLRCCLRNYFDGTCQNLSDHTLVVQTTTLLGSIQDDHNSKKISLLYNEEIKDQSFEELTTVIQYINLLIEAMTRFPQELTLQNWDSIRIGLSSWILGLSRSMKRFFHPKATLFIVTVYRLFASMMKFVAAEKQKSSTVLLQEVCEEWEKLFAREVNLVCFKAFYELCNVFDEQLGTYLKCYIGLLEYISPCIATIDIRYIYDYYKTTSPAFLTVLSDLFSVNLRSPIPILRLISMRALKDLIKCYVVDDVKILDSRQDTIEDEMEVETETWHKISKFRKFLKYYEELIVPYIEDFNFTIADINDFRPINERDGFSYLLLWDCLINACASAPLSLRSTYTKWLSANKFDTNFFTFLFRSMPPEILKNYEMRTASSDVFKDFNWDEITDFSDGTVDVCAVKCPKPTRWSTIQEKYACHLYVEVLRKLPAAVRKWWNASDSRKKGFVDKLTTNFVSPIICQEELKAITQRKERHENMSVKVHMSTREVLAVYSIDEARMELVITLAQNYPLGGVKVECGKQIGGRLLSRNVGMQLTLFLMHQNGTIYDGLILWKNNLDKKFEGVEECYVCYTVIHQDTCKLPQLSCKTCKKKFHNPCLYKWFTTSNKSTCPICRNIF